MSVPGCGLLRYRQIEIEVEISPDIRNVDVFLQYTYRVTDPQRFALEVDAPGADCL
ncbi:MAG: hypothetical protein U9Q70_07495 [Chloroflexota bacterium]|nr:hypothetical protein [Chloroflexota bacterium]